MLSGLVGFENEFESGRVDGPLVFESLKFYTVLSLTKMKMLRQYCGSIAVISACRKKGQIIEAAILP